MAVPRRRRPHLLENPPRAAHAVHPPPIRVVETNAQSLRTSTKPTIDHPSPESCGKRPSLVDYGCSFPPNPAGSLPSPVARLGGAMECIMSRFSRLFSGLAISSLSVALIPFAAAQGPGAPAGPGGPGGPPHADAPDAAPKEKPDFPPFAEVTKGYEKVISFSESGKTPLYTLYKKDKDQSLLAELPQGFANQKHYWAMTVASGDTWAGLQGSAVVAYWRRYDKSVALVQPNFDVRSTGDEESKAGVKQQISDRVLLDVPIKCIGPSGQPVIDLKALLAGQVGRFFGGGGRAGDAGGPNPNLATFKEIKAFPENIEVEVEIPVAGGQLRSFHYSISRLPENTGYKPREADERVGYFTTSFRDLGKFRDDKKWIRYVNRWNLEKRDPNLRLSPPKTPIVFYIDNKVPVRYRRFVREGILEWNKAFEKVGIADAIEVYYQDAATGANMEKDPEDVRYNFIRWLANDQGTAIGPSRTDPRTGQILDADIVLTDGWIRHFWFQSNELLPEVAMTGMSAETLAFLDKHPDWDPRVRLADPSRRDAIIARQAAAAAGRGFARFAQGAPAEIPFDGILGQTTQFNGLCLAARGKGMDMALMRLNLDLDDLLADEPPEGDKADEPKKAEEKKDEKKGKKDDKKDDAKKSEPKPELIDGIPVWFVGPMLADLVSHEVGHTLGLRHNFKASSIYSLNKINSYEVKGEKPFAGSVMDYIPVNINRDSGPVQGDYAMRGIGPYDYWAIEFGYTSGDTKEVLKRCAEPELVYLTDEDVGGSDPLARPYDFAADPLDYANNQLRLIEYYRSRLLDKFVKDGDSWSKARRGYFITLSQQLQSLNFMAPWIGGAHVARDHKGDPNARPPVTVVPVEKQRAALRYVIESSFRDQAFGLSPELMKFMTVDKWADQGGMRDMFEDSAFPVHDRIMGIQATALTLLLNPTTLKRVYDNELRTPKDQDMLTLPEVMNAITSAAWTELDKPESKTFTDRDPMISSLRRNLQREHLTRLIDLSMPDALPGAAGKPISNLAIAALRDIRAKIDKVIDVKNNGRKNADEYTYAHLAEAALRIDKALDASFIYNTDKIGGGGFPRFLFGQPTTAAQPDNVPPPATSHYGLE